MGQFGALGAWGEVGRPLPCGFLGVGITRLAQAHTTCPRDPVTITPPHPEVLRGGGRCQSPLRLTAELHPPSGPTALMRLSRAPDTSHLSPAGYVACCPRARRARCKPLAPGVQDEGGGWVTRRHPCGLAASHLHADPAEQLGLLQPRARFLAPSHRCQLESNGHRQMGAQIGRGAARRAGAASLPASSFSSGDDAGSHPGRHRGEAGDGRSRTAAQLMRGSRGCTRRAGGPPHLPGSGGAGLPVWAAPSPPRCRVTRSAQNSERTVHPQESPPDAQVWVPAGLGARRLGTGHP